MTFARRLRFFGFGAVLGILLSLILFGPEKFSCSGYLPQGRVLAELQTKKFQNDSIINTKLDSLHITSDTLKEKILVNAEIKFDESEPRLKPCPNYSIYYPKDSAYLHFIIYKCDSTAYISEINQLKFK